MDNFGQTVLIAGVIFALMALAVVVAWTPISGWMRRREAFFAKALYQLYRPEMPPGRAALASAAAVPLTAFVVTALVNSGGSEGLDFTNPLSVLVNLGIFYGIVPLMGAVAGVVGPVMLTRFLIQRRVRKLEDQIVSGIQTLASGVRAGLNLVQSFEVLAKNAPPPLCQEVGQMLREYEHGLTLEQSMSKTGLRIGSPTYRLLFSALETHRVRGGNLGETLDRIADAIREIQRLEKHVETLTAQGRAAARMMAVMPFVILAILYMIDTKNTKELFVTTNGRVMLLAVAALIGFGFWWIRRIVDIDI